MRLNFKKTNNPIKKWAEDINRNFSKDLQMANKHEKMLNITNLLREMQIKTTMRYHLTLALTVIIKKYIHKCWREYGKKGTLLLYWWEYKLIQPLWRTVWSFLKNTKNRVTIWPSNSISEHKLGKNHISKRYMKPNVHCNTIYNSQGMDAT